MKNTKMVIVIIGFMVSSAAFAANFGTSGQALDAAESAYGNDPMTSKIKSLGYDQKSDTVEFHVAVGIGNPEDGQHNYDVKINSNGKLVVTEIDRF